MGSEMCIRDRASPVSWPKVSSRSWLRYPATAATNAASASKVLTVLGLHPAAAAAWRIVEPLASSSATFSRRDVAEGRNFVQFPGVVIDFSGVSGPFPGAFRGGSTG